MDGRCDDEEKVVAMDALYDYYAHDQLDQYQALAAQRHQNMLPLMCRTLLPHRYEVSNIFQSVFSVKKKFFILAFCFYDFSLEESSLE